MITLTDLFCGAGGSSTGAVQVPGVQVRVASNHWDLAVETHEANHPDTGHVCADLSQIDPRYYPRTDILWASPECTNHSIAKGSRKVTPDLFNPIPDEAQERSRATMWDVPRFTEVHRYSAVIVENVVDVARWHPYRAWLMAMDSLGYDHEVVFMNSMHAWEHGAPAPQSRDRFYAIFWRKGNRKPDLAGVQQPPAWCPEHGQVRAVKAWKSPTRAGRYRTQYVFRCPELACKGREVTPQWIPASSIIDWSDLGTRIGDRPRPLAEKTMRRIQAGIDRYWTGQERDPLVVNHVSGSDSTRATTVADVAPTMVAGGLHASLLVPVEGREGKTPAPVSEPYRTQTTRNETGILTPFVTQFREGGGRRNLDPQTDPLNTIVSSGGGHGIVCPPFITELRGGSSDARAASDSLSTVTASGNHHGLTTGKSHSIEDASFRMLSPDEIKRAMAFPKEYRILGTKRDQVRMSGNAVTPPAARDLIAAVASSLEAA
ncbi:MAG: DNA cytosine methyltransferase [Brachybacterium sp.]|uniref:DNA cytosine methyltransferase n=1 Tax=Brachybacterium sp. TaxID=1891286 RepID=UPI002648EF70|nr:DNA cytosine methyltransferase [Brachybacterium sp.]MDN5687096.1 DNA cytosine methyltransferase [Brachybacterium sp.]